MKLMRTLRRPDVIQVKGLKLIPGDATHIEDLNRITESFDAIVHLIGIIREFPGKGVTFEREHVEATLNIVALAEQSGAKRFLHMSANSAAENADTGYQTTKWQGEQIVRRSGLDWTIFRPSVIFGAESDFVRTMLSVVKNLPIVPVIGSGRYEMQPVAVEQVADSFVRALDRPQTIERTYCLGGAKPYSYIELLNAISKALGKGPVKTIRQPVFLMKPAIKILESFQSFPITSDQLTMLQQGNVCDSSEWADDFDIEPIDFADGIVDCV